MSADQTANFAPSLVGLDLGVIAVYLVALLILGFVLEKLVRSPSDMFAAGGRSPWWLSGISAYMTMFSSGTFVVWGGIAYMGGMVAVSICMTFGISALLAAVFLAAKWKDAGVSSAAEFVRQRFGNTVVHVCTWLGMLVRIFGSAVALYSIAVIVCSLIHIPAAGPADGWGAQFCALFRDNASGTFSQPLAIILIGVVVLVISGNLWAVLITDGLQFIVLAAAVTMVVPLLLRQDQIGGLAGLWHAAGDIPAVYVQGGELLHKPGETLASLVSGPFTWLFLGGWIVIHFFKIGGEWSFVQRFVCVPTRRDAVKAGLTFGALYLLSPLLWMLPPVAYRIMHPLPEAASAPEAMLLAEKAYMLACASVLPAGLVGLLLAAMLSATMSMIDSEVNVYAGAVTRDIYARLTRRANDPRHLLRAGRFFTIMIGSLIIGVALAIPYMGGAQNVIITVTGLFVGPLVLPVIWALFSKYIGVSAFYLSIAVGALCSALLKFGLSDLPFIQANNRAAAVVVGIIPPLVTLVVMELIGRLKQGRITGQSAPQSLSDT